MALFDQLGGREWVRRMGATLDGPTTDREVRLAVAGPHRCNRVVISAKKETAEVVYRLEWWRVSDDGEDADPGRSVEGLLPAEIAAVVEREAARNAKKGENPEPAAELVA